MYSISVMDPTQRYVLVAEASKNTQERKAFMVRGTMKELPVIRLPLDGPIYRMRNGRTMVKQFEYIRRQNKSDTFFSSGEENVSPQSAQHAILAAMARDSKGNIFSELKTIRVQTEPLMITTHAVVVNGNRRLAAMRELFAEDTALYGAFGHVNVMVLPGDTSETEIETIETELQLAPETKLDYGWIERRLKLRILRDELQMPMERIVNLNRFKTIDDVNRELTELALAEEYLERYRKEPRNFALVEKNEQLFKDLCGSLRAAGPEKREPLKLIAFTLAKEHRNLGTRSYSYNPAFGSMFEQVVDIVGSEFSTRTDAGESREQKSSAISHNSDDPLEIFTQTDARDPYAHLIRTISDQQISANVAKLIKGTVDHIQQGKKEDERQASALSTLVEARKLLESIDLSNGKPGHYNQISQELTKASDRLRTLETQLHCIMQAT